MKDLSLYDKYRLEEIAKELNLSKRLINGIRKNFGEPISLYELTQSGWSEFIACRGFGLKSWYEFRKAISEIEVPKSAVKVIDKSNPKRIIIEMDISKPFEKVIIELSQVMKKIA